MYLHTQPELIVERMRRSGEIEKRPLLKEAADPADALRKLYEERKKNYSLVSSPRPRVRPPRRGETSVCLLALKAAPICYIYTG